MNSKTVLGSYSTPGPHKQQGGAGGQYSSLGLNESSKGVVGTSKQLYVVTKAVSVLTYCNSPLQNTMYPCLSQIR